MLFRMQVFHLQPVFTETKSMEIPFTPRNKHLKTSAPGYFYIHSIKTTTTTTSLHSSVLFLGAERGVSRYGKSELRGNSGVPSLEICLMLWNMKMCMLIFQKTL